MIHMLKEQFDWVETIRVTPDFKRAISGGNQGSLIFWDLETGKMLHKQSEHTNWIMEIQASPDFRHVMTQDSARKMILWDLEMLEIPQ